MKTVRISDKGHERLVKVAGRLQAASGKGKSLDDAITMLTLFDEIFTDYEVGLEFEHLLYKEKISKEQAFLWFWGLASLAKMLQDCYGFDSVMKYSVAFDAKHFSDHLEALSSDVLDSALFKYFEKQNATPVVVKKFLRKCGSDGFGNWVRMGKFDIEDLKLYLKFIICYENGKWEKKYIENVERTIK